MSSAADAFQGTHHGQNPHLCISSDSLCISTPFILGGISHRYQGAFGPSDNFGESVLAEFLGLLTQGECGLFGSHRERLPSSEKLRRGMLWIPSAFELTLNLLGRR